MDEYEPVTTESCRSQKTEKSWLLFLRQAYVCSGPWVICFMYGLCTGMPTVAIPQIRREANSTEAVTNDMASWMPSAIHNIAPVGMLFLPSLSDFIGRRWTCVITSVGSSVGFVVLYYSKTPVQFVIGQVIQGVLVSFAATVSLIIITEYSSPKYRGVLLTLKSAGISWGIWISNALGTFFHWKNICLVGIIYSVYGSLSVILWPESPYWLALKKHMDKCESSHRWLKGTDTNSKQELEGLIALIQIPDNCEQNGGISRIYQYVKLIVTKPFLKSISLCFIVMTIYCLSGKLVCHVYAIDIIKNITNTESTAYTGMLILDGLTVAGMYAGCGLTKVLNRRTQYLVTTTTGVVFLYVLSIYLYIVKGTTVNENPYFSLAILSIYSISISMGPMVMSTSVYAEIMPISGRNLAVAIVGIYFEIFLGILLKISPYLFNALTLQGTFLFFGISSTLCLIILYKYLPETKDRTILEIGYSMQSKPLDHSKEHHDIKSKAIDNSCNRELLVNN